MALSLCVLLVVHLYYVSSASVSEITASLRSLSPKINDDAAPPVFCLEVGVEIAFPSRDVEDAMGSETEASAGTGCLRSSPMNAVMDHLKVSLRTFSLHAVDCVLEPMDVESSTIALLGITSLCSRSNMDVEEDMDAWGREAKRQVDRLFETEKRISLDQTTGMFVLGETLIWSDDEKEATKDQTFFTHVHLHVKNDGKTPLHLYRLTLVEKGQGRTVQDKTVGFVLPLVAPAVVPPGMSEVVSFKAITGTAVDSTKSYLLYISHSGFRSHVFEGILDGKTFLSREEAVQPQGEDGLFDRFSLDSVSGQSLFPSFPYATWQVGSMAIAVAVGLAVTLYIRRKRPTSSRAAISKRGEDHIEMESLIKKPNISEASNSDSSASIKLPTPPRSRMPAITMKWKAPPPPPQTTASVTKKTLLAIPKALETQKLLLDLDHKARLHPKRFESMWDEYVERFVFLIPE
ncbi:hypothetical protein JG688_00001041 [Phytophthora aleatoria]|uniref:Dolichyl-diphosphooligosaccharide--protein glycosyltransferase subunit 1 n=1 Tax=Phytophthora aleatoria TaxID=2496075 RepID=A0A8J5J4I5_9STRA|nr:hypothetical protein JG688_00001041 [Phytophthora aleatoria]